MHVSYVHSPMRYAWDLQHQYLSQAGMDRGLRGLYARWLFARLRLWDVSSAHQVDHFVANSSYVARANQEGLSARGHGHPSTGGCQSFQNAV